MKITSTKVSDTYTYGHYQQELDSDPYDNSEMKLFKDMSSRKKGSAFEKLVSELLVENGYLVTKPNSSNHDRIINNKKVEIKGSLGWVSPDGKITHYRFQQIRDQDYDVVLFAFFTPTELILKVATKRICMEQLSVQNELGEFPHNQHGGKKVNSGTFFIDTLPDQCDWMVDIEELL